MCINIKLVTSYKSIYVIGVYSFQFCPVIWMFSYSPQEAFRGKMTLLVFLWSLAAQIISAFTALYLCIGSIKIKSPCACTFTVPCRLQVIQYWCPCSSWLYVPLVIFKKIPIIIATLFFKVDCLLLHVKKCSMTVVFD